MKILCFDKSNPYFIITKRLWRAFHAIWAMIDFALDIYSVVTYYKSCTECQDFDDSDDCQSQIPCGYFYAGLCGLILPTFLVMLTILWKLIDTRDYTDLRFECTIALLFPLFVQFYHLFYNLFCVFACQGEDGKNCKKLVQMTDNLGKIIELVNLVGEAFPELVISCLFISHNGGAISENTILILSALFSAGSLLWGITRGLFAARQFDKTTPTDLLKDCFKPPNTSSTSK